MNFWCRLRNGDGVFVKYSYENCFEFLKKFKNHHIVIVRPDFHFQNTYSCFTSFLKGDRYGNVVECKDALSIWSLKNLF